MSWFSIQEIASDVFAIAEDRHWERVRSYLFRGSDISWLVDTGTGIGDIHAVVTSLTSAPIRVVTTHVHWDHIGGHDRFEEVLVHCLDADWLRHGIPLSPERIRAEVAKVAFDAPADSSFDLDTYAPPTVSSPRIVEDGTLLESDAYRFRVLHTPGHSPGSLCLHELERGLLITGDLLYRGMIYADYPSTDPQALLASYCRLAELEGIRTLLPGHNDSSLPPAFIRRGLELLEQVDRAGQLVHGAGVHSAEDIAFRF